MSTKSEQERQAIIEAVFEGMADGKTVADTARKYKLSPGTVRKWIADDEQAYARYVRMRPMMGAAFAEEAIRVARESSSQTTAVDRVLIETLKWGATKNAPLDYGEKQTVEHQGAQTISVKVVEENHPIRNQAALGGASGISVVAKVSDPVLLPAGEAEETH